MKGIKRYLKDRNVWLSLSAVGITLIVLAWAYWNNKIGRSADHSVSPILALLFGSWVIVPPFWFLWEWHAWDPQECTFEELKYGQELARNLWIAVAAALGLLLGFKI